MTENQHLKDRRIADPVMITVKAISSAIMDKAASKDERG
jgi:hypothetical protein